MDQAALGLLQQGFGTAVIGLLGALLGGLLTGIFNLLVQRSTQQTQFANERQAERARWDREDELRNIDERRHAYTEFMEKMRLFADLQKELDGLLGDLKDLPILYSVEYEVRDAIDQSQNYNIEDIRQEHENLRRKLGDAVAKVEQLRDAIQEKMSEMSTLLTQIELLGSPAVMGVAEPLFEHAKLIHNEKAQVVSEGLKLRQAQLADPGSTTTWQENTFRNEFERIVPWAEKQLDGFMRAQRKAINQAMRENLKVTKERSSIAQPRHH